jgi:dihydroorotate dehydrogenase
MPSMAPDVWRADVSEARNRIRKDQMLVVSVVGTPTEEEGRSAQSGRRREDGVGAAPSDVAISPPAFALDSLAEDFARCARWAAEAGADAVEANFSCPNVCSAEGMVYRDPVTSRTIAEQLRAALPATPLLIKAGYFAEAGALEAFLRAVGDLADGVVLVNAVSRRVLNADGSPTFGPQYERVGILGGAIHPVCVENVRQAVAIRDRLGLHLRFLAVGGVFTAEDAAHYFDAGADAVLMGGAPMFYPDAAIHMKAVHPEW